MAPGCSKITVLATATATAFMRWDMGGHGYGMNERSGDSHFSAATDLKKCDFCTLPPFLPSLLSPSQSVLSKSELRIPSPPFLPSFLSCPLLAAPPSLRSLERLKLTRCVFPDFPPGPEGLTARLQQYNSGFVTLNRQAQHKRQALFAIDVHPNKYTQCI